MNRGASGGPPPSRGRPRSPVREAGFTLIEVVVAFVLLTLVLSTGFEIFTQGMARAGALEERSRALEVARSALAEAGMEQPLKADISQGDAQDPRFHWTRTITPYDESPDPNHPIASVYSLYRIDVKVDWRSGDGKDRSLALSTLDLGSRQQ